MTEYDLTLDDVVAYVASKNSQDDIGIPNHACKCLLASTLAWKYHTSFRMGATIFRQEDGPYQPIGDIRVAGLGGHFDELANGDRERFPPMVETLDDWPCITKAELEDNPYFAILFVEEDAGGKTV